VKLKILFGFLILFLFFGFVHAGDNSAQFDSKGINYFESSTDVNLGDFNFTVPRGFGLVESEQIREPDGGRLRLSNSYINNESDILSISVNERGESFLIITDYTPADVKYEKVGINNHSGVKYRMDNSSYFEYFEKEYVICIQAPDDDYFEGIIN
jgi:hypothetical protein